jgi:hypothetical protein
VTLNDTKNVSFINFYNYKIIQKFVITVYENNKIKSTIQIDQKNDYKGLCLNDNVIALFYNSDTFDCYERTIVHETIEIYQVNEVTLWKSKVIDRRVNKIFINDDKIFIITEESPFLNAFNENLELLGSTRFPGSYSVQSNRIFIANEKIFIQKGNVVCILKFFNSNLRFVFLFSSFCVCLEI